MTPADMESTRWKESIRNGYVLAHLYYSLSRNGVLAALREAGPSGATVETLAAAAGVRPEQLEPCLFYILHADRILTRDGQQWALTGFGRTAADAGFENSLTAYVGAYGCVLQELNATLSGRRRYGADFERRGELVAEASLGATRAGFPFIVNRMRQSGVECVADLGCGAAGVLLHFCALDPKLKAIGIDISPAAIDEARARVEAAGLADRIELVLGDLADVERWRQRVDGAGVGAFHCTGVLHELLRDGPDMVKQFFAKMRDAFPRRLFFLGEFDGRTEADYRRIEEPLLRVKDLWYQDLIHPLTNQGKPQPRQFWVDLLAETGVEVVEIAPFRHNIYVLQL